MAFLPHVVQTLMAFFSVVILNKIHHVAYVLFWPWVHYTLSLLFWNSLFPFYLHYEIGELQAFWPTFKILSFNSLVTI